MHSGRYAPWADLRTQTRLFLQGNIICSQLLFTFQLQNGPRIHENSKRANTKVETSDLRSLIYYDIEHCHCFSYILPNLQLNNGKKYLNTAKIIDNSLLLAIVLRNYSTKPSYIFQLKRELTVWIYIFNHSTFCNPPENQSQNGPRIHENSKRANTKVETSDSCFG
jgi:hypothetical protein